MATNEEIQQTKEKLEKEIEKRKAEMHKMEGYVAGLIKGLAEIDGLLD